MLIKEERLALVKNYCQNTSLPTTSRYISSDNEEFIVHSVFTSKSGKSFAETIYDLNKDQIDSEYEALYTKTQQSTITKTSAATD